MKLESYTYGFLDKLWLKLESRSSDRKTENLVMILPVLLFMQKEQLEVLLDNLPKLLSNYLKPHLVRRVFHRIVLRLKKYTKNEQLFIQDRQKAIECIAANIQLYALVIDLLQENTDELDMIEQIVRKKFDKDHLLSKENTRLLAYQEKHFSSDDSIESKLLTEN